MNPTLLVILRVLHVVGGSFWFGSALLNTLFLGPSLRAAGPAGGDVMRQMIQVRKLPIWINATALVTLLSGLWLYGWRSAWFGAPAWMQSASGITFALGGLCAIAAAVVGGAFIGRSAARIGRLAAAGEAGHAPSDADQAEIARLQRRMARASVVATFLIFLATLCMAIARYV